MGASSDPEILSFFGLYEDKKLQKFIDQRGNKMAAISHRPDLPFEFKIVDSPVVNAFAVPGGYVYFTRGIMAHFNNEAEFAGVLGHEIGHVTARHSAKQYSKATLAQVGMLAGMVISPEFRQFADLANTGVSLLFLKFGRDAERQSDLLGVAYSTKVGYDAQQMAGFFSTLQKMSEQSGSEPVPTFMSTHPHPQDRFERVGKLTKKWQKKLNVDKPKVNRDSYLRMIDGLVYGQDPRQGYVENGTFYHPVMKFQYPIPANWSHQNSASQVQMAPKDGRAMMALRLASGTSPREAAEKMVQANNLRVVESEEININGLPAVAVVADQQAQQGGQAQQSPPVRIVSYFIQDQKTMYNLLGYAAQSDFQQYYPAFERVATNFQKLTDQDKINRQPDRISIQTVAQSGTLKQTLRSFKMPSDKLKELALLNGMELSDRVEKGTLIKTIQRGEDAITSR